MTILTEIREEAFGGWKWSKGDDWKEMIVGNQMLSMEFNLMIDVPT